MIKKILAITVLLLFSIPGLALAEETMFWPDGWSYFDSVGSFHRSFGEMDIVQKDDQIYFLTLSEERDHNVKLSLQQFDLTEQQVVSTGPTLNTNNRNIEELSFDKKGDTFYISWMTGANDLYYATMTESGEVSDPKHIYSGDRAMYSMKSFNINDKQYYLWREVYDGSANILSGHLDEDGNLSMFEGVFLGNDNTNYVKDVYTTSDKAEILWVSDQTLDGWGQINLFYTIYDGETVETIQLHEYVGISPGTPKFVSVGDELKVAWRQTISMRSGVEALNLISLEEGAQPRQIFSGPTFNNFDIIETKDQNLKLVLEVNLGYEREIYSANVDLQAEEQNFQRLTYDSRFFWTPKLVQHDGYQTVLFAGSERQDLEIFAMNNKFTDEPSMWRQLGLNEDGPLFSGFYFVFRNFMFAGLYTIVSILPLIVTTAIILTCRKYGVFNKEGRRTVIIQMIFGFTVLALFREARWAYFFERLDVFFDPSYTFYTFVATSILVLLPVHLSSMWKEDTGIPLSLALFIFIDQLFISLPTIVWYQ
ncbi:hypothetical protein PRVXH_000222 [Proteinivorax hydrogeniformans]|uniref:Uncharacterized protein n=1 Tax=Proteinivorax hydrogeniformans TaxID=1826727 RepID=A0AAU8HU57_9FIRM